MISAKELRAITEASDAYLDLILQDLEPKLKTTAEKGEKEFIYYGGARGDTTQTAQMECSNWETFKVPPIWVRMEEAYKKLGFGFKVEMYKPNSGPLNLGVYDEDQEARRQQEIDNHKHYRIRISW